VQWRREAPCGSRPSAAEDGGWVVENEGVPPDVEVEQWPAEILAGKDPQLDKAIEIILQELKKHPSHKAQRPAFPVRVGK
jgi:tricorn protease